MAKLSFTRILYERRDVTMKTKKHRWVAVAPLASMADWLLARVMRSLRKESSITSPT